MKVGSYELSEAFASGATSTVHLARVPGATRVVAVKRLHPHLAAREGTLRARLVEEARIVGHIAHPNVVQMLETVETEREVFLVMEHVEGETLERLLALGACSPAIAVAIARDVLAGLHAAHHARDGSGAPLGLVHRDVSPKNVIVGTDGRAKLLDFGIAKVEGRARTTRDGHVRGTLAYMAPEQLEGEALGPRADVYAMGVVAWEALTGRFLVDADTDDAVARRILDHDFVAPSTHVPALPRALDAAVMRALARAPEMRFASALEMALALEESLAPASAEEVGAWVESLAGARIRARYEAPALAAHAERARTLPPSSPSSRWIAPAMVAAAIGLVGVAVIARGRASGPPVTIRNPEPSAASVVAHATTAPETPSARAPAPTTTALAADDRHPDRERVEKTPSVAGPRPTTPSPSPSTSASTSAPPAASTACSPYWVDSAGRRRFNRECLQ